MISVIVAKDRLCGTGRRECDLNLAHYWHTTMKNERTFTTRSFRKLLDSFELPSRDGRIRTGDPLNPILSNPGIGTDAMRRKCLCISGFPAPQSRDRQGLAARFQH